MIKGIIIAVAALLMGVIVMKPTPPATPRIWGISLVAPPREMDNGWTSHVKSIKAGWVAVLPYAYSEAGDPVVHYDSQRQWWGERSEGIRETIRHARAAGLNVMLKPMVWIPGSWPGSYDLDSEEKWKTWEKSYETYVLGLTKIALEEKAQAVCIGTEFKMAAVKRPKFWKELARKVRITFPGAMVTYAANWDEYGAISFWPEMDYIGIDAYFPLSDSEAPEVDALCSAWDVTLTPLEALSKKTGKKILFTEFGYRSVKKTAWRQWELEHINHNEQVNLTAQKNAYEALFRSVTNKDWFAGGFIWQWYNNHSEAGGKMDSDYTPQNKPAEALIRDWFGK